MNNIYSAIQISEHVYWVGAIDWSIRDFHGYTTPHGSTYNAYLVMADKITLIDTVKSSFMDEMLSRIASVVDPSKIDYIVSNHSEQDHTGCLLRAIDRIKPEKVFASAVGVKTLKEIFHAQHDIQPVKDGETLSLGNMDLRFLETRMIHWPDSMFSYLEKDGVLFSQDAFGMHLATFERFADQLPSDMLEYEAATYYANIVLPYSPVVLKALDKVAATGWSFKLFAPDHGPVWRQNLSFILDLYKKWALQKPANKAVVVYATMWHSTEMMAKAIAESMAREGIRVKLLSMNEVHRSEVIYEVLEAGALIVGSPTLNNNILPQMADVMTYIKGLKPSHLIGAVFGSYGWSGESVKDLEAILKEMKVDIVAETVSVKHVPGEDVLEKCSELGRTVAAELKKRIAD
ncbi:MAG: Rubredoxin-oxygen oxidoreductase [Deltaproteobacteria bacterium ADurb.Bin151]|jgi:flavorubredoxin|nr:FprA family A-type flavoprotein [Smithella sp.]OQB56860.1 MAG: Rubredoxin-oxygen oxidoreductase [Deltaproteobacteria bacterium ADurb.Bin151]HNZ10663.1 FprA family A-type flavoprotein [Smithellaceae bacterium]HOG81294.1 FprA family A-type flavoprotein [Smithellaceae bacterium]HOQ41813.1 FprA family A-type flavoprotein [Smithellaceae bacterium]